MIAAPTTKLPAKLLRRIMQSAEDLATKQADILANLRRLAWMNRRLGLRQRLRGLHYWLGMEYAILLSGLTLSPGQRVLDIGTGGHSIWPYIVANIFGADVVALDVAPTLSWQAGIRARAVRAGLCRADQVQLVRADGRQLPFSAASFDAFTALSSLEHVEGEAGDREALQEAARLLRPGGIGAITVPFRRTGSLAELGSDLQLYQRHYSAETLCASLLGPSGLQETARLYFGEQWPFYHRLRQLPALLRNALRPLNPLMASRAMTVLPSEAGASAVMMLLQKRSASPSS